ncbi:MAG TPA: twin-arginine translocase TatA/TatE family subunit [Jiangellaceae bacterium]
MFGLQIGEILVILVVVLLVFGPDRLPEMTKQLASWVRDLRQLVANARRDLRVSASDLGLEEEDIRTLRQLRNPKAFVRDKVLDGADLDEFDLNQLAAEDNASSRRPNTNGQSAGTVKRDTGAQPAAFDPDAT